MGNDQASKSLDGEHLDAANDKRRRLLAAVGQLSGKDTDDQLVSALRGSARSLAGADGITVVHREGTMVRYVAEDAIEPLWAGQSFPVEECVSGLALLSNEPVLLPDIYADSRVPHAAYEATFVRSMAVFPIGMERPEWAIGAYWAKVGPIDPEAVSLLSSLARSAAAAFARAARSKAEGHILGRRTTDRAGERRASPSPSPSSSR